MGSLATDKQVYTKTPSTWNKSRNLESRIHWLLCNYPVIKQITSKLKASSKSPKQQHKNLRARSSQQAARENPRCCSLIPWRAMQHSSARVLSSGLPNGLLPFAQLPLVMSLLVAGHSDTWGRSKDRPEDFNFQAMLRTPHMI